MAGTDSFIQDLVTELEGGKGPFLVKVHSNIYTHISRKSTLQCLELVSRRDDGTVAAHWAPRDGLPHGARLLAFCMKKRYDGLVIDSALTDGVVEVVANGFAEFYQDNSDLIARKLLEAISQSDMAREAFIEGLLANKFGKMASSSLKSAVFDSIAASIKTNAGHISSILSDNAGPIIAKATAAAAAAPITKVLIVKSSQLLAAKLGIIIAKLMAMPAVKAAIAAAVKKFVVAAMVAYFANLIVAKTGLSIGAVVAIIVVPIIAWYLVHEWTEFPDKLAGEIARAVARDLGSEFRSTNKSVLHHLFEHVLNSTAKDLGKSVAGDPAIEEELDGLIRVLS